MNGDILFLAHRVPFPPDRGDKIRSHHLLRALARLAPVHVGCFGETDADMAAATELQAVARSHCLIRRTKPLWRAGVEALVRRKPGSLTAFDHRELRDWVHATLASHPIDTIVVFSGQMGQYVPRGFAGRVVIDLCDVDSAKFEAYAKHGHLPRAVIDGREGRLLAEQESRLARRADSIVLVSEAEATLFRQRTGAEATADIRALRNGIDTVFFDPGRVTGPSPFAGMAGPHLVFTGQMDYPPNVAAVQRVAGAILPAIRRHHGDASFHIVGRAPAAAVKRLDRQGGVRVWGEVPDVRPFLASADVVLAPLTIARGVQNKVLEAMAMARPVVLSPEAATGIDACDGVHFLLGGSDAQFASRTLDLLGQPGRASELGRNARGYVVSHQGWDAMLEPLAALLGRDDRREVRHVA